MVDGALSNAHRLPRSLLHFRQLTVRGPKTTTVADPVVIRTINAQHTTHGLSISHMNRPLSASTPPPKNPPFQTFPADSAERRPQYMVLARKHQSTPITTTT